MPTEQNFFDTQGKAELKKYTVDFTEFIPSGASVSGANASYRQTFSGTGGSLGSGTCATSVSGGSAVTATTPALNDTGSYALTIGASLSDGQYRTAYWYVRVDA